MNLQNGTAPLLVGDSVAMQRLRALIAAVAPTRLPILIEGATGSGKELVAALLHEQSRRDGAYVAFNVCALGETMFEDALFGHAKGAYTGAMSETLGFLREANGGTVFLDEISGLPLPLQAKLLRAIETGVVRPIGSSRDAHTDCRTIAATNERLDDLVARGQFRADLAHRLRGMVLRVPSLAERVEDIPALAEYFVERARPQQRPAISDAALRRLQERAWPGNVRELKQVVESALVFSRDALDVDALDTVLAQRVGETGRWSAEMLERQRLLSLLVGSDWDTERAAADLGVHRTTIYRRMRRLGISLRTMSGAGSAGQCAFLPTVLAD
jgi:two-component system nitrogen regulation response regulator NtrX